MFGFFHFFCMFCFVCDVTGLIVLNRLNPTSLEYNINTKTLAYYTFNSGAFSINQGVETNFGIYLSNPIRDSGCQGGSTSNWFDNCAYRSSRVSLATYTSSYVSACLWLKMKSYPVITVSVFSIYIKGVLFEIKLYNTGIELVYQQSVYISPSSYYPTQWSHICFTFDLQIDQSIVYWNGASVKTISLVKPYSFNNLYVNILDLVYFDEIRVFSIVLSLDDIKIIYKYRGSVFSADLYLACPTTFTCNFLWAHGACFSCGADKYINSVVMDTCAKSFDAITTYQLCFSCKKLGDCVTGTYMSKVCAGTDFTSNECISCTTLPCTDPNFYRTSCTALQDATCVPYTVCPIGFYLKNPTMYANGVCTACSTCAIYVQSCSARADAVCSQICNLKISCVDTRSVCSFGTNPDWGVCAKCPPGFSKINNACIACPPGAICDELGQKQCNGVCLYKQQPFCQNGNAVCMSGVCPAVDEINIYDPYGTYTDKYVEGTCIARKVCNVGYYLALTGYQAECKQCINESQAEAVTNGLSVNNPHSCVWEKPTGGVANFAGFYSSFQTRCPWGYTSQVDNALVESDCRPCPTITSAFVIILKSWLCTWTCMDGYQQVSDGCTNANNIVNCNTEGLAIIDNECIVRPIPWQPAGNSWTGVYQTSTLPYVPSILAISITYNPLLLKSTGVTIGFNFDFVTSINTLLLQDSSYSVYTIKSSICSITHDADNNVFHAVFCGVPIIFFMNKTNNMQPQRLIGQSTSGYLEGMKNEALFGIELYVYYISYKPQSILVLDTINCLLREIIIGDEGPGDFMTKSYFVAGTIINNNIVCDILKFPRYFYPLQNLLVLFINDQNKLCQYHVFKTKVVCMSITIDTTGLRSIISDTSGTLLYLIYTSTTVIYSMPGTLCPDDYTSLAGGGCSIYKPWNNGKGYYIQNGVAIQCAPANCPAGQYSAVCSRNSSASCITCTIPTTNNYIFSTPGTCDYNLLPPCPKNSYVDETGICVACPGVMFTRFYNGTSFDDCLCPFPLTQVDRDCILLSQPSLFYLYPPNDCDFFHYFNEHTQQCTYCKD